MRYHNITTDDMLNGDGPARRAVGGGVRTRLSGAVTTPSHGTRKAVCCLIRQQRLSCSPSLARTISPASRFPAVIRLSPATARRSASCAARFGKSFRIRPSGCIPATAGRKSSGCRFFDQIDVLIDGRFVQAQADPQLHWRGSANQRVIDVPRTLAANSIVLHDDK